METAFADNRFFVIPDDETKTLTISPTEDKYTAIRLDKALRRKRRGPFLCPAVPEVLRADVGY